MIAYVNINFATAMEARNPSECVCMGMCCWPLLQQLENCRLLAADVNTSLNSIWLRARCAVTIDGSLAVSLLVQSFSAIAPRVVW